MPDAPNHQDAAPAQPDTHTESPLGTPEPTLASAPPSSAESPAAARATRSNARRAQVLAAASALFRTRGFHGTSMAELAKAAGMSVGHVYHYFPSKEAIIEAIGRHDLEDFMRLLDAIGSDDAIDALVAGVGDGVRKATDTGRATLHIEVLAESSRNAALTAATARTDGLLRDRLRAVLRQARPDGEPPDDEHVDTRIDLIQALFEGVMCRSLRGEPVNRVALTALLQAAMRTVLEQPIPPSQPEP